MEKREKLKLLLEHVCDANKLAISNQISSDQFRSLIARIKHLTTVEVENARLHEEYPRGVFYVVREEVTAGITPETLPLNWTARLERAYQAIESELDSATD